MTSPCVYLVARGAKAYEQAQLAMTSVLEHYPDRIRLALATDQKPPLTGFIGAPLPPGCDSGGRLAKLAIFETLPDDDRILYLDADTRVLHPSFAVGWRILEAGWDMVIVPSEAQGDDCLWNVSPDERAATYAEIGNPAPLSLQGGVWWVARNDRTEAFFQVWREEWLRWHDQDQAALLRALSRVPLRVWLLGRPFNDGAKHHGQPVIQHRFGAIGRR